MSADAPVAYKTKLTPVCPQYSDHGQMELVQTAVSGQPSPGEVKGQARWRCATCGAEYSRPVNLYQDFEPATPPARPVEMPDRVWLYTVLAALPAEQWANGGRADENGMQWPPELIPQYPLLLPASHFPPHGKMDPLTWLLVAAGLEPGQVQHMGPNMIALNIQTHYHVPQEVLETAVHATGWWDSDSLEGGTVTARDALLNWAKNPRIVEEWKRVEQERDSRALQAAFLEVNRMWPLVRDRLAERYDAYVTSSRSDPFSWLSYLETIEQMGQELIELTPMPEGE